MGVTEQRKDAKRTEAIARLRDQIAIMERIQHQQPTIIGIVVPATHGREVNRALFALSDDIGGMEQIRTLMIRDEEFNPTSGYSGVRIETVPLAAVLSSARRTLRVLGVYDDRD